MIVKAPGKINLYLGIEKKLENGFHSIKTVFEKISVFDEIEVDRAEGVTVITCDDETVPTGRGSLIWRAVKSFKDVSGESAAFRIHLRKKIPVAAGLGGGSSDVAAVLKAMNVLTGNALRCDDLIGIGKKLGSDVPFFLSDASIALGRGRGDLLEPLKLEEKLFHIVINPPFETLSGRIYALWDGLNLTNNRGIDRILTAFQGDAEALSIIARNLHNDLQTVVLQEFTELKKVFEVMEEAGVLGSLVSGSGPSVFGLIREKELPRALDRVRSVFPVAKGWRVFSAETF